MPHRINSPEAALQAQGADLGVSAWMVLEQPRIQAFADATDDWQWIHLDPERAAQGPFGGCIAHGYLTLSLCSRFLPELLQTEGVSMGVNYGLERVRFPAPVRAGSRIRGQGRVLEVKQLDERSIQMTVRVTIEVEGQDKPACVADTVSRFYFQASPNGA